MGGQNMIYVDEIRDYGPKGKWCHMWGDDIDELHHFARGLGLRRDWLHLSRGITGDFHHFDLRPSKRELALQRGAEYIPLRNWIKQRLPGAK
jgi:hypothetical protein